MPRPKKPGGPEPKRRSRNGCWPCKTRKIKCGEEKPKCQNCERQGETCDYSIRLNWEGRTKRKSTDFIQEPAKNLAAVTSGSQPRVASRLPAGPILGGSLVSDAPDSSKSQILHPLSGSSSEFLPTPKKEIVRDAYTLEAASKSHMTPFSPYETSPYALPMNPRITSDVKPQKESRLIGSGEDESGRASIAEMSFVGMHGGQQLGFRDHISTSQLSRIPGPSSASYPSPTDSSLDSPPLSALQSFHFSKDNRHSPSSTHMPPPPQNNRSSLIYHGDLARNQEEQFSTGHHTPKRLRMSPTREFFDTSQRYRSTSYSSYSGGGSLQAISSDPSQFMSSFRPYSPLDGYGQIPFTPVGSMRSGDSRFRPAIKASPQVQEDSPDRRLSVSSLLVDTPVNQIVLINYGVDRGFPDVDLPTNKDDLALNGHTPTVTAASYNFLNPEDVADDLNFPSEFGFGLHAANSPHGEGGYYEHPVQVAIPRSLGDLPTTLQQNPMNLLYFHHFLNHTARILVPHDCSENPFKSILPQMAVSDNNLLHLLLAYSASHRARLLNHREPCTRIALWVQDVFPSLRRALNDPTEQVSNTNLATAIMLASLEIISPNTFEVRVSWQNHLSTARSMLLARGQAGSVHRKDRISYFLSRWFAYLDVLGSLSGGKNDQPLFIGNYWMDDEVDEEENSFQIDCLLGFTTRCISILAQVAELARICDSERIDSDGNIYEHWRPTDSVVAKAEKLKAELQEARTHRYPGCPHHHDGEDDADSRGSLEMEATNDAFHWAGLVHLNRRVLRKDSTDPEVQMAVMEIMDALHKVRKGSTAEACLLFPMFTAGCDALRREQRDEIMDRLRVVEGTGMTHVNKARRLMEKVWETGRPWETLVSGEFFG